jgi:hypothetical protein
MGLEFLCQDSPFGIRVRVVNKVAVLLEPRGRLGPFPFDAVDMLPYLRRKVLAIGKQVDCCFRGYLLSQLNMGFLQRLQHSQYLCLLAFSHFRITPDVWVMNRIL